MVLCNKQKVVFNLDHTLQIIFSIYLPQETNYKCPFLMMGRQRSLMESEKTERQKDTQERDRETDRHL